MENISGQHAILFGNCSKVTSHNNRFYSLKSGIFFGNISNYVSYASIIEPKNVFSQAIDHNIYVEG